MPQDWDLYKTLLHNLNVSLDQVIHVRGNHDVFKVSGINSSRHYGRDLFQYRNESEFHFQIFYQQTESGLFKFVLIHPYHFPIGPICFTAVDAFPGQEYYNRLQNILMTNDSDITFLITHYPAIAFSPSRKIEEIYSKSPNQRFVIAGHWHKRLNTKIMHHGPTLELIISAIVKSNNIINIMTIDNKRVVNHQIDIKSANRFLITNPVPYEMNVGNGFFNSKETEIRVLTFSEETAKTHRKSSHNLTYSIVSSELKGIVDQGRLNCETELEKSVLLCSAPLKLREGNYTLIKEGEWEGQMNFFIGSHIPPFYDKPPDCLPIWEWYYLFVFVAFFFSIILFPFPSEIKRILSNSRVAAYYKYNTSYLYESGKSDKVEEFDCFDVFLGFLYLHRFLFNRIPLYLSSSLFFCFFYVLFLPLSFFEVEGQTGVIFSWGYICGKKVLWHFLGGEVALRSIYFIIAPVLFLSVLFSVVGFSTFSITFSILYEAFNLRWFVSLIYKLIDMSGVFFALTSPVIYLPFILYFFLIKWLIEIHHRRRNGENHQSSIPSFDAL